MAHPRDFPFHELSVAERILPVQDLCDSIAADTGALELSDEQEEERDRRLVAHEANPDDVITWDDIRESLRKAAA